MRPIKDAIIIRHKQELCIAQLQFCTFRQSIGPVCLLL